MSPRLAAILLAACVLHGCEASEMSEILVVVDSDLRSPVELDRVEIEVIEPNGEAQTASAELGSGELLLPRRLGLVHRDGPLGPLMIAATARLDGELVVERTAHVSFLRREVVALRMDLLRGCIDVTCRARETCAEGGCRMIDVGQDELLSIDVADERSAASIPIGNADAAIDGGLGDGADAESESSP